MRADGRRAALSFRVGGAEAEPAPRGWATPRADAGFVPESRFGVWFLNTQTWSDRVLKVAIADLRRLMQHPDATYPVVLDVGCGHGRSLPLLMHAFRPERLIGIDREKNVLANAARRAAAIGPSVTLIKGDCSWLPLREGSVDLIFCHQTFHHLVYQERALREFHRVLRPCGVLLFAESTRAYIEILDHPPVVPPPDARAAQRRRVSRDVARLRLCGGTRSGLLPIPVVEQGRSWQCRTAAANPAAAARASRRNPAQRRRRQGGPGIVRPRIDQPYLAGNGT